MIPLTDRRSNRLDYCSYRWLNIPRSKSQAVVSLPNSSWASNTLFVFFSETSFGTLLIGLGIQSQVSRFPLAQFLADEEVE